jgi:GT2 family glycosyltransferase
MTSVVTTDMENPKTGAGLLNPLVYIVTVNFRNPADTIECVRSIEAQQYGNYKIIIVDNHSCDDSEEKIRASCGLHVVLQSGFNGGYASALNIGISYALKQGADYVLILNNDTILDPAMIRELVNAFSRHPDAGACGPKILRNDSRRIWFAGGTIDLLRFVTVHKGHDEPDGPAFDREERTGFLIGCCILIKKEVFESIGLLDDHFFLFFEDTDYSLRMTNAGLGLYFVPAARLYHKVSSSIGGEVSPFALEWWTRSRRSFMKKHHREIPLPVYALSVLYFYSTRIMIIVGSFACGRKDRSAALLKALWENES